jgi:hypothetical protein
MSNTCITCVISVNTQLTLVTTVDNSQHLLTIDNTVNLNERGVMADRKFRSFATWPENQERLEFADKRLGLNVSELINEVLQKHLKSHMEAKAKKLREALSVPIP